MKLPIRFYLREDTLTIAKELIGKFIYTSINGEITGGMIVETEAYIGPEDRGSHAFEGRRTAKNETMYHAGGVVYMYICYGIHDMLNIVTGLEGSSHAILIRAIEPTIGIQLMQFRRGDVPLKRLCKGPGSLAKALGLNKSHNQTSLTGNLLWIEDDGLKIKESNIIASSRVGLSCLEPYLSIPWRFTLFSNSFVSK
nr:DNA-3-methyladenine glycosylase [Pseudopedobacter sp.]